MPDDTHTLEPGEFGFIVRKSGELDVLVPGGTEDQPLSPEHCAVIGAFIAIRNDPDFAKLCHQRYRIEFGVPIGATAQ